MEEIILIGYGGHSKSVADCIERQKEYKIVGYTDLQEVDSPYPYLGTEEVLYSLYDKGIRHLAMGIGYLGRGNLRENIYAKAKKIGFSFPIIIDPSSIISSTAVLEEGAFVGKLAIVNAAAHIGKLCIINTKALVEHDCVVGDFTHVAVGAVLCGQVNVGRSVLVGANATVLQCQSVRDNAIIPAGFTFR